jgi:hypothetical protein
MNSNRFRFVVAALLVAVVALTLASPASAFIRLTRQGTTGIVQAHWYDSELPLLSVVNPTNSDQPYATAFSVVMASAKAWENVNTSYFTVNPVDYTSGPYLPPSLSTTDGQNSMFFDMTGANFATGSGVIAFVRSIVDLTDGHTLDADLVFNDKEMYASVTDPVTPAPPGQYAVDLQSVITHEYGHYFSLDHTSVANATMIPFILTNSTVQRTLELDDQAGVSAVYPESAARGLSPDGVDFYATRGTLSGTVVSGYNGSAIFGAHVEAWNLALPVAEQSISAISGELTVRNGQGDYVIRGLPPGNYAVRIVPLDGVNTIAADANVGGIFNGLDINFPPEWWNGANESGNGFNDNGNDYTPVAVTAGADAGGIAFVTNAFPGQVEIAPYGDFENTVTHRFRGFRAVRFDPPFDPPYTIMKIVFPTFTFNGVPATFPSVRLCAALPNGRPDFTAPVFSLAPFSGSPDGVNEIPIDLTVTDVDKTYFWCWEFPAQPYTFPNNFPFLRMDFHDTELGIFAASYDFPPTSVGGVLGDRNIVASMVCRLASPDAVPIEASSALGANRRVSKIDFSFLPSRDVRADGFPMPRNSLLHTNLIWRDRFGPWRVWSSGGAGTGTISVDSIPGFPMYWSTQAVDKFGHRALPSSVVATTGFMCVGAQCYDAEEPNGRLNEATPLILPVSGQPETRYPSGDQDFYSFYVRPGDVLDLSAASLDHTGNNDLDLIMVLYDGSGKVVAFDDDSHGGRDPRIVYAVPPHAANSSSKAVRKLTVQLADVHGSILSPSTAPRGLAAKAYLLNVRVASAASEARSMPQSVDGNGFGFAIAGPNPANPVAKLTYVLPQSTVRAHVVLRIYDVAGRVVRMLVDRPEDSGRHTVAWDGTDNWGRRVSSGTYYARLEAGRIHGELKVSVVR